MRNRPPVENMPTPRPVCPMCSRPLRYWTNDTPELREGGSSTGRILRRVFYRWRGYPNRAPIFDRLECALDFALAAHRAGYRRTSS